MFERENKFKAGGEWFATAREANARAVEVGESRYLHYYRYGSGEWRPSGYLLAVAR